MSIDSGGSNRAKGPDGYALLGIRGHKPVRTASGLINRYPVGCALAMLMVGGGLAVGVSIANVHPRLQTYAIVAGAPLAVFGALLLLVTALEMAGRGARRLVVRPDPALAALRPLCNGHAVRYETSRTEMIRRLEAELGLSAEAAEARLYEMEQTGKLVYMPAGHWAIVE